MLKIENDCCGCSCDTYPCDHCGKETSLHYYCDKCGEETELYYDHINNCEELCMDCIKEQFNTTQGKCNVCGYDEMLYIIDDDTMLCEECLEDLYEPIRD